MIRNFSFITDLAGGGATQLDGIFTAGGILSVGMVVLLVGIAAVNGGGASLWQLQARNDATAPGLQRPLDFDAASNPVVWTRIY